MKLRNHIVFILVFFILTLCSCNANGLFDKTRTNATFKQTDTNLESTGNSSIDESESVTSTDAPICDTANKEYDGIFVRTSIEDYISQIEKHQDGKLVNYPTDVASVFIKYGFTEACEIALTRMKDLYGNYFRFEELSVKYHMPECKNESHSFCKLEFTANICEVYDPIRIGSYKFINTVNGLEIYEYSGPYDIDNVFKIKMGEFAVCTILIPYDIVGEEKANEILNQIITIAEKIKKDLTEIAPELITG